MKKIITSTAQLLTLVLVLTLTGCTSKNYQQTEEIITDNVDKRNLKYFENVFINYEDFLYEDYSILINNNSGNLEVTLDCLDATGKVLKSYNIQGDIFDDILNAVIEDNFSAIGYSYELDVEESNTDNKITGTRISDTKNVNIN